MSFHTQHIGTFHLQQLLWIRSEGVSLAQLPVREATVTESAPFLLPGEVRKPLPFLESKDEHYPGYLAL